MKKLIFILFVATFPFLIISQNVEIIGKIKITDIELNNTSDSLIVMLPDGTLTRRDLSTILDIAKESFNEGFLDAGLNGIIKDIDGNTYKTIKIGTQVWMAENLKTTRYNDGTAIQEVTDNTAWYNLSSPGYCWYDNDSAFYAKLNGALYNYYVVADTNSLNVCPTGWHVPSDAEWTGLTTFLTDSGYGYEGSGTDIAKSLSTTFRWTINGIAGTISNDQGTNNSSGFTGFPAGYRSSNGNGAFVSISSSAYWWSSTESPPANAWNRFMSNNSSDVTKFNPTKGFGYSVRCLRD